MIADITASGRLRVIPESEMEEYALRKWWEGYTEGESGESVLEVVTPMMQGDSSHD